MCHVLTRAQDTCHSLPCFLLYSVHAMKKTSIFYPSTTERLGKDKRAKDNEGGRTQRRRKGEGHMKRGYFSSPCPGTALGTPLEDLVLQEI